MDVILEEAKMLAEAGVCELKVAFATSDKTVEEWCETSAFAWIVDADILLSKAFYNKYHNVFPVWDCLLELCYRGVYACDLLVCEIIF